jgi:hypothetical protein
LRPPSSLDVYPSWLSFLLSFPLDWRPPWLGWLLCLFHFL